eukprot:403375296
MLQGSIESSPNHTYESILLSQSETEKMQNGQNKANQLQFIYQGRDVHNKDVFEKFQRLFNENEQSEILEQFIQASSGNSRDSQTKNKFTQNLYTKTQLQAENLNSNQQLDHQKFQDYLKRDMTPIIEQKSTFEQSPSVNDLLRIISGQSLSNKISANVGKSGNINSSWNKRDQIQTNRSFYRLAGIMVLFCLALYSLVLNLRQDHSSSGFYNPIEAIQQFLMTKNLTTSQDQQSITISLHNQQLQSLNQTHHENLLQLKYELKQSELELKYLQSRLNDTQQNYDKCQNEKVLIESDLKQARAEIVEVGVFLSQELKNKAQSHLSELWISESLTQNQSEDSLKALRRLKWDVDTWSAVGAIISIQLLIFTIVIVKYYDDIKQVFFNNQGHIPYVEIKEFIKDEDPELVEEEKENNKRRRQARIHRIKMMEKARLQKLKEEQDELDGVDNDGKEVEKVQEEEDSTDEDNDEQYDNGKQKGLKKRKHKKKKRKTNRY